MMAATVIWAGRDRAAVTPPTSQMRLLGCWGAAPPAVRRRSSRRPERSTAAAAPGRLRLATSLRGPRRAGPAPLLRIPLLPAGEYDVVVERARSPGGHATVGAWAGSDAADGARGRSTGTVPGSTGLVLRLPVNAHSITVSGDEAGARHHEPPDAYGRAGSLAP